jgi:hypothetical protein
MKTLQLELIFMKLMRCDEIFGLIYRYISIYN